MEYRKEPVKGYEEYQVDTNGVIYSKKGKPLKYSLNYRGYCIINFYINHKRTGFGIHTLVATQFIPNDDPLKWQVNHKDGNKENNCVDNLEWMTPLENTKHSIEVLGNNFSGGNNPNSKSIKGISKNKKEILIFNSLADAGRYFSKENYRNIMKSIWKALNGRRKSYHDYIWEYC
jgi:hypothetical protein